MAKRKGIQLTGGRQMGKFRSTSGVAESAVQLAIVEGLRLLGYTVLITSRIRKSCEKCGHYSKGGDGVTKGVPDLLVCREEWGAVMMPLEVKGSKTKLSPEQVQLYDAKMIYIARSWEDAIERVELFERAQDFDPIAQRHRNG